MILNKSRDAGTGRQVGLKNQWSLLREGSIPSLGTIKVAAEFRH